MSKEEKIYVGSGKIQGQYNDINITINIDKLKEYIYKYEGKNLVNLTVGKKREVDQYGKSHSVTINTYKPDDNKQESNDNGEDQLPF